MSGENSVLHDLVAPHEHILHVLNITLLLLTVMCICFGSQTIRLIEGLGSAFANQSKQLGQPPGLSLSQGHVAASLVILAAVHGTIQLARDAY